MSHNGFMPRPRFGGVHEIADLAGVTKQAVNNWMKRHSTFPQPLAKLRMGPIYNLDDVQVWLHKSKRTTRVRHVTHVTIVKDTSA